MPVDKTIIKVPKIAFTQLFPNVVSNFSQVTYNEGIYITNESKKATYPKSVIRIYKNPNNPKKVYFAAKDTSLLENYVLNLINIGATKENNPETFTSVAPYNEQSYYWSKTETEDSYRDYSLFSQPNNLALNESSVANKTLNLFRVPQASEQVAYLSGLNSDYRVNNNFYEYGVFLKAKSAILDNQQYESYEPNKYLSSVNFEIDSGSFENKTLLYEKFLFNDLEDYNNISPLSETDLELFDNATIKSVNKINFSDFIVRKFDDLLVADSNGFLFPDKSASGGETYLQVNVDSKMVILFKKSPTSDSVYYPIYDSIDDEDYSGYKTELPEPSVAQPDDEEGQLLIDLSVDYLDNKKILFIKDNNIVSTIKDYEMVDVKDILNYRFYSYDSGPLLNVKFNGSLNLQKRGFETFGIQKRLDLEYSKDYVKIKPFIDTGVEIESFGNTQLNSSMYVFKDSFNYSKYNFFPIDFNETIYEFELDKELNVSNGAFVVAEIE